jgi:hypothetical protein
MDELEIAAFKKGILLKDDAKIWHNAHRCNDEKTYVGTEAAHS